MSYYGLDPHDWRDKLPKGVRFYDFADGSYQVPITNSSGTYLTTSLVALCEDPVPSIEKPFRLLGFAIPYAAAVRKNSDWGPIIDKMIERWNKGVEPIKHGDAIPIEDLWLEASSSRPVEQSGPDAS